MANDPFSHQLTGQAFLPPTGPAGRRDGMTSPRLLQNHVKSLVRVSVPAPRAASLPAQDQLRNKPSCPANAERKAGPTYFWLLAFGRSWLNTGADREETAFIPRKFTGVVCLVVDEPVSIL